VVLATRSSTIVLAELLELVERDHPVPVARAVEQHDLVEVRQLAPALLQLGELAVVLGEHHAALGVGQDVGDVLGDRRGVDGGGRRAGAHDREVGDDPLVARVGRDAHALLGLDAEGDEARREAGHLGAGLLPGDRLPGLAHREPVGLVVAAGLDAVQELTAHGHGTVVDDALVDHTRHS
jgi:hypothetical protein